MPGASFVTMAMAARIRMKMPLTSDALLDTMPANTSFQMLSCLLLDRLAVQQRGIAGRLRGEQLVLRHADHPSSFAPYLMRGSR